MADDSFRVYVHQRGGISFYWMDKLMYERGASSVQVLGS